MSYWILAPFLLEAAEASRCYFFENRWKKLKCPNLLKPLETLIKKKYWSFYPSGPFSFDQFTLIHPVGVMLQNDGIYDKWIQYYIQNYVGIVHYSPTTYIILIIDLLLQSRLSFRFSLLVYFLSWLFRFFVCLLLFCLHFMLRKLVWLVFNFLSTFYASLSYEFAP